MIDRLASPSRLRQLLRSRDERGSATLVLVILMPAVLLLTFGTIQGALYYHARTVALAAAQEGLSATRVENGTASAGAQSARQFLADTGDGYLEAVTVTPSRSATTATVTVAGSCLMMVPGMPSLQVSQTATGPVERYTDSR